MTSRTRKLLSVLLVVCLALTTVSGALAAGKFGHSNDSPATAAPASQPVGELKVEVSTDTAGTDDPIVFTATGVKASAYRFTVYSEAGDKLEEKEQAEAVYTYKAPDADVNIYCFVSAKTSAGWVDAVSGWVAVKKAEARPYVDNLKISVSTPTNKVAPGQYITINVTTLSGQTPYFYRYQISNGATLIDTVDSGSASLNWKAPTNECNLFVIVLAYNGWSWQSAYSNWFSVMTYEPVKLTAVASPKNVNCGDTVTITTTQTAGGQIQFYRYMITDGTTVYNTIDSANGTVIFDAPMTTCNIFAYILAWDGNTWGQANSNWVSVTGPKPLAITLTPSATSVVSGESMYFAVSQTSGSSIQFVRYILTDQTGVQLATTDTTATAWAVTVPDYNGNIVCTAMAFDGYNWAIAYSGWVTAHKPTYRALVIGNTYPGTESQLVGPANDSQGMYLMLSYMNKTPYNINKQSNLTKDGIVSAIRSTFKYSTTYDVNLFYYSGHGASGTGSLIGTDFYSVTPAKLRYELDQIPGKKIIIVDACHSGAIIGKDAAARGQEDVTAKVAAMTEAQAKEFLLSESKAFNSHFLSAFRGANSSSRTGELAAGGYYVLCAAHSTQLSWESGGYGRFTTVLNYGCGLNEMGFSRLDSLYADTNGDKQISLDELYKFLQSQYDNYIYHNNTWYQYNAQVYPNGSSQRLFGRQ